MARLRDPIVWADTSQLAKTVVAAVIAWLVAVKAFGLAQPFLAPWAAMLVVHPTVYRTLKRGLQQAGAAVLGVLLAFAAGTTLGVNAAALAVVLTLALAAGLTRPLRAESTTAAATALVVLLTGYSDDAGLVFTRLLDTGIGIAVGLLVNLLVWPPLRDRSAARRVDLLDDELGELICEMARTLREGDLGTDAWVQRTRELDGDLDRAWGDLQLARESGRLNPRRRAHRRVRASEELGPLLGRLEQAVAETRSMARTVERAGEPSGWDPRFRAAWLDLLARAGAALERADVAAIEEIRDELEDLPEEGLRPVQGALLVNLRNIIEAMDAVVEAQPVRVATADGRGRRSERVPARPGRR
jgi:uncharacterized membrane protein YccC